MKKVLLVGAMLLIASSLVIACGGDGVSEDDHNKVVADLFVARGQIATLQSDYTALEQTMAGVKALWDMFALFIEVGLAGEDMPSAAQIMELFSSLEAVGDPELTQLWEDVMDSGGADKDITDFLAYLADSFSEALE